MEEYVVLNSAGTVVKGPAPTPKSFSRVELPGTITYPVRGNKNLPHTYDGGNGYYTIHNVDRQSPSKQEFQELTYSEGSLVGDDWVIGATATDWPLEKAKSKMKSDLKRLRNGKRSIKRDIIVNSVTYPVSLEKDDTDNMDAAVLAAVILTEFRSVPGTTLREYTFSDQTFSLTYDDFIELGLQTLALVDNLYIKQRSLRAQIDSAGSVNDLRLIDTDTGW